MRKIFYLFALGALLASCSVNKSSNEEKNDSDSTILVETSDSEISEIVPSDDESEGYNPPFTVTAVLLTEGGDKIPLDSEIKEDGSHYYGKSTMILEVFKNGKYKGQLTNQSLNHRTGNRWWQDVQNEFDGRWSTVERRAGEGYQKIYDLHWDNNSIYIPDDCEYIYLDDWSGCRDFNTRTKSAWQVTEVVKNTGVIKTEVLEDDGKPGPELWDETYEGNLNGKIWKFVFSNDDANVKIYYKSESDPSQEWRIAFNESYKYKGKTITIADQFKGTVSADGKSMTLKDGFGDVYNLHRVE